MFYLVVMKKDLDVHPRHFGKSLKEYLHQKLVNEVEGTCHGKYGYVVAVVQSAPHGQGVVRMDGTGFATFTMSFSALICRPYKGEVMDAIVTSVNKMGFFAEAGPLQIFVSNHSTVEQSLSIKEGSEVRLRIMGTKMDHSDIFCIGSIKEDYLGLISLPE